RYESLLGGIWFAWGVVTFGLLIRLGAAVFHLARLVRRSPLASAELQGSVRETACSLNLQSRFEVRLLDDNAMPMACWLGRWFILLPRDIVEWPSNLRRTVIAHELGHVARRDAWSDFLTQLVCRCLWFHPLLWVANRQVPRLREAAC